MKIKVLVLFLLSFPFVLYAQETSYKIGTHHSLSYSNPKWYWAPLNWIAKCQELDLNEQLCHGVTYFDIRVRFKKGKVISGHGMINYDVDVLHELEMLNLNSSEENPLYVRIMYESKPLCKNPTLEEMKVFMDQLRKDYPALFFTECHIKEPYTLVERDVIISKKDYYQFLKDYDAKTFWKKIKGLKFPCPKYYAIRNNPKYWNELDSNKINIFDFVDIK
jgi:hypothetical protein